MDQRSPLLDLSGLPAMDTHCHSFPNAPSELTSDLLRDSISVSLRSVTSALNETIMLNRIAIRELANHLGCNTTFDSVVEARNARSVQDYTAYIGDRFGTQTFSGLLFDPGFPAAPMIDGRPFASLVPIPIWEGYRIERFVPASGSFHGLANVHAAQPFNSVLEEFEAALDFEASSPGFTFFKSIIAYRTGLSIRIVEHHEASSAWENHRVYGDTYEKPIRDYLFAITCRKAQQHGVPLQLHTGHTSHVNTWPNVNPILLTPILNSLPDIARTRIVLVHGGYPYCLEAGYLTSVYPNVWCNLSLMIPWASVGIARRIEETLESAPTSKLMYGSDGINIPEMNWLGALVGRRGLGRALTTMAQNGLLSIIDTEEVAADIHFRTAEAVLEGVWKGGRRGGYPSVYP